MDSKKGIITTDPSVDFPIGGKLIFDLIKPYQETPLGIAFLKNWDSFDGVVLCVQYVKGDFYSVEGSAVMVGPGIAIAAKHVLEEYVAKLQTGEISILISAITKNGLQIWKVKNVLFVGNSDLAILRLEYSSKLPPDNIFKKAGISTRFPKLGENLMLVGFRASEFSFESTSKDGKAETIIKGRILVARGDITNRFSEKRDSHMLPWPTLEVNCPSVGGMSGGPVFDSNGMLIGVLASSLPEGPSYVSLLWPALTARFSGGWPAALFDKEQCLLDLAPKLCFIDKPSCFVVSENDDGTRNVENTLWENIDDL